MSILRPHLWPLSLRGRLAGVFAIGSAFILVSSATFIYRDLDRALQQAINGRLRAEADALESSSPERTAAGRGRFVEILDREGRQLVPGRVTADQDPLLTRDELRRAAQGEIIVDKEVEGLGDLARLLVRPTELDGRRVLVVVGRPIDAEVDAQRRLAIILFVFSPVLVLVLSGGGWLLASAALRPVARMAEDAAAISMEESGRRLPEPKGNDEIAHLGRTLNAMLSRIEATFARERAFVDDASHELRTPVSILRAELELALLRPGDPQETQRVLRSALEEADHLGRLAEDLLVLSRAQGGQLPLRRELVDVAEIARRGSDASAGGTASTWACESPAQPS